MKNISLIISVIALSSIVVFIVVFLWDIVDIKEVPEKPTNGLRVMSYNIKYASSNKEHFNERKVALAKQIQSYEPDSIGIQEGDALWMSDDEGLPSLLDNYAYIGVGRDDGKKKGEYSAIFYDKDKYHVVDSGTFWLSPTPEKPSRGWDAINRRICTWVTLENKKTHDIYTHYNTHLDYLGVIAKIKGINMLVEHISECEPPVVLTGDFNFFQDTGYYQQIVKSGILVDSKFVAEDSMSHGTVNLYAPFDLSSLKPVDFCFISPLGFDCLSYRVDNSYRINNKPVSDHYPLIVDLSLRH